MVSNKYRVIAKNVVWTAIVILLWVAFVVQASLVDEKTSLAKGILIFLLFISSLISMAGAPREDLYG